MYHFAIVHPTGFIRDNKDTSEHQNGKGGIGKCFTPASACAFLGAKWPRTAPQPGHLRQTPSMVALLVSPKARAPPLHEEHIASETWVKVDACPEVTPPKPNRARLAKPQRVRVLSPANFLRHPANVLAIAFLVLGKLPMSLIGWFCLKTAVSSFAP